MEVIQLILLICRMSVTLAGGFPVNYFLAHHSALVSRLVIPKKNIYTLSVVGLIAFGGFFFKERVTGKVSSTYPDPLYVDRGNLNNLRMLSVSFNVKKPLSIFARTA